MTNRLDRIALAIKAGHDAGETYSNLTGDLAPRDEADAYAAQARLHALHAAGGRGKIGGRKIALASKVQQELCGVDHPIAGGIFADEIIMSPSEINLSDYHGLGIEFELAVIVDKEMNATGAPFTAQSVRDYIGAVHPALEMIIDREADYGDLNAQTMIADNAWSAGVILGAEVPDWQSRDFDNLATTLNWNDEEPQHAVTGLADPLGSLAWVANLVTGIEQTIKIGHTVITGSVIKTRYPKAGDEIRYEFDGLAGVTLKVN